MMITIPNTIALEFLRRDRLRYLGELITLVRAGDPVPVRSFADGERPNALMVVAEHPHGPSAALCGAEADFVEECLGWLRANLNQCMLSSTQKEVFQHPVLARDFEVGTRHCSPSFVCTSLERVALPSDSVTRLEATDASAVSRYPQEPEPDRPAFARIFELFVVQGKGAIFAAKEGDELLGYLSCSPEFEEIWDVEFIHVRADRRRHGLGWQLAAAYAREMLGRGQVPYYSGPRNEASSRVAQKAGFTLCREFHHAQIKSRR